MIQLDRIKSVQKSLRDNNLDALIVSGASNNYWLTKISDKENKNSFYTVILKNDFRFVTTKFHLKQATERLAPKNIAIADKKAGFEQTVADILKKTAVIGFESEHFTYAQYEGFKKLLKGKKMMPLRGAVELLRQFKDDEEIKLIRKAAAITDKTFSELLKLVKPGVTELWLKQKAIDIMLGLGSTGVAFDPVVASGKNSADPHYEGSNKKIKAGEMVVIDIGARYKNYDSDMTRMVFMGKATEKYKKLYRIVLETEEKEIANCKLGAIAGGIYDNAVENFKKYGEDQYFTHSLGHGVGTDIHELPNLSPSSTNELENAMVFSIEPGLYHIGWGGIRVEDLCLMQNGKCATLSKSPKHLIEIL
jgi:Xaa-Pro aminopeptidase